MRDRDALIDQNLGEPLHVILIMVSEHSMLDHMVGWEEIADDPGDPLSLTDGHRAAVHEHFCLLLLVVRVVASLDSLGELNDDAVALFDKDDPDAQHISRLGRVDDLLLATEAVVAW